MLQPISQLEIKQKLKVNQVETTIKNDNQEKVEEVPLPKYGPHPNTKKPYNFDDEVAWLPFKFYLGDTPFTKEQQDGLLNFIYDNQQISKFHIKNLGYYDKLAQIIPTMRDKPTYLPHKTIQQKLQGEVYKCYDMWVHQGIIRPSQSLYTSQVV